MPPKLNKDYSIISKELARVEAKIEEILKYVEDNPIGELVDRIEYVIDKQGTKIPKVISTIEAQARAQSDLMKMCIENFLPAVKHLREREREMAKIKRGAKEDSFLDSDTDD